MYTAFEFIPAYSPAYVYAQKGDKASEYLHMYTKQYSFILISWDGTHENNNEGRLCK